MRFPLRSNTSDHVTSRRTKRSLYNRLLRQTHTPHRLPAWLYCMFDTSSIRGVSSWLLNHQSKNNNQQVFILASSFWVFSYFKCWSGVKAETTDRFTPSVTELFLFLFFIYLFFSRNGSVLGICSEKIKVSVFRSFVFLYLFLWVLLVASILLSRSRLLKNC